MALRVRELILQLNNLLNIFAFPQSNLSNYLLEKDSQKRIKKWFDKDWF